MSKNVSQMKDKEENPELDKRDEPIEHEIDLRSDGLSEPQRSVFSGDDSVGSEAVAEQSRPSPDREPV